jgi:hypothetical protein
MRKTRSNKLNQYLVLIGSVIYSLSIADSALALTYHCETTEKYDFGRTYTKEELLKFKFSVRLEEGQML